MRREDAARVVSPCVEVCTMDVSRGLCIGCHRTLDEIARWASMTDRERQAVMDRLEARRRQAPTPDEPAR